MIRDPSDGTVRIHSEPLETKDLCEEQPLFGSGTSGLPITKGKAEYLARLEKSREWLRDYWAGKK